MRLSLIIIFFSIVYFSAEAIENNPHDDYAFIYASSLNLRDNPNIKSNILTNIKKGSVVKIIKSSNESEIIDGLKNIWYKVSYDKYTGWLFGGYIVNLDKKINQVTIDKKSLPFNKWNNIINSNYVIDSKTKYIDITKSVPAYKSKEDIITKKSFVELKELLFFYITDSFYNEKEYETASYSQFQHPKYGKIWISNNKYHCTDRIKSFNNYNFIISTTEPVIEGDRNDFRLIITLNNKVVDATLGFKNVGAYARSEIINISNSDSLIVITMICGSMEFDNPFYYTYAIFNEQTNKIESIYEYSYK